jgi:hypothetical protein
VETFRFVGSDIRGFKLAVIAPSLRKARAYVRSEAIGSIAHRLLKYVGKGAPPNPQDWCAAIVRS